jgi:hypothetical protein
VGAGALAASPIGHHPFPAVKGIVLKTPHRGALEKGDVGGYRVQGRPGQIGTEEGVTKTAGFPLKAVPVFKSVAGGFPGTGEDDGVVVLPGSKTTVGFTGSLMLVPVVVVVRMIPAQDKP